MSDLLSRSEARRSRGKRSIKRGFWHSYTKSFTRQPIDRLYLFIFYKPQQPPVRCRERSTPGYRTPPLRPSGLSGSSNVDTTSTGIFSNLKHAWRVFKPRLQSAVSVSRTSNLSSQSRRAGDRLVLRLYRLNLIWIIPAKGLAAS